MSIDMFLVQDDLHELLDNARIMTYRVIHLS